MKPQQPALLEELLISTPEPSYTGRRRTEATLAVVVMPKEANPDGFVTKIT